MNILEWLFLTSLLASFFSPCQPLQDTEHFNLKWTRDGSPEKHTFKLSQPTDDPEDLSILLSDGVIATHSKTVNRYQVFRVDRVLDFSSWSRLGHNIAQHLKSFRPNRYPHFQNFVSREDLIHEYYMQGNTTFL